MRTQKERVLSLLRLSPGGVCSNRFVYSISPGIPRIAARIADLRGDGWGIATVDCVDHVIPTARHASYRLEQAEEQLWTGGHNE